MKLAPLAVRGLLIFLITFFVAISVGTIFVGYRIVQIQRIPNTHRKTFATDQFKVLAGGQVETVNTLSVRKGCVATFGRGFARIDPDNPDSIDIQIVTPAPPPIGVDFDDLEGKPKNYEVLPSVSRNHVDITYRIFTPIPQQIVSGKFWHYVEILSQPTCGWLHGILPVDTTISIGPELTLVGASTSPALKAAGDSGHSE